MSGDFPNLANKGEGCTITSPQSPLYNCIAWAAGKTDRQWWPRDYGYWPRGVSRELSMTSFVEAFKTLGYQPCTDGRLEKGYEKVVFYARDGDPTHAARQLPDGGWTSKLGKEHDLSHRTVGGVEGPLYGKAVQYMRRPITSSTAPAGATPPPAVTPEDGHDADDGPVPTD